MLRLIKGVNTLWIVMDGENKPINIYTWHIVQIVKVEIEIVCEGRLPANQSKPCSFIQITRKSQKLSEHLDSTDFLVTHGCPSFLQHRVSSPAGAEGLPTETL